MSPATAIALGRLGGLGVLNLEGLWTRYDNPESVLGEIRSASDEEATVLMQRAYQQPVKPELIRQRLDEIRQAGVPVAGGVEPSAHARVFRSRSRLWC